MKALHILAAAALLTACTAGPSDPPKPCSLEVAERAGTEAFKENIRFPLEAKMQPIGPKDIYWKNGSDTLMVNLKAEAPNAFGVRSVLDFYASAVCINDTLYWRYVTVDRKMVAGYEGERLQ